MSRVFRQYHAIRTPACFCIEFLLISLAVVLAAAMWFSEGGPILRSPVPYLPHAFLTAFVCQICMWYADLYNLRVALSNRQLFIKLLESLGVAMMVLGGVLHLLPQVVIGRGVLLLGFPILFCFLAAWRLLYQHLYTLNGFRINVLILGTGAEAKKLAGELANQQQLGYDVRGFIGGRDEVDRKVL